MNNTLSSMESAALAWLAGSDFAHDPQPVRMVEGALCIEYWHAEYSCFGMLVLVESITGEDMQKLITATERQIAARQYRDVQQMVSEGIPKGEAHDTAYGYPTRAALCVPLDEVSEMVYEAYLRAAGTFDEPMVIAVWDGGVWSFDQEEAE